MDRYASNFKHLLRMNDGQNVAYFTELTQRE